MLTHDPKLDNEVSTGTLDSSAFYIGSQVNRKPYNS